MRVHSLGAAGLDKIEERCLQNAERAAQEERGAETGGT